MWEQKNRTLNGKRMVGTKLVLRCLLLTFFYLTFSAPVQSQVISASAGTVSRVEGEVWFRHRDATELHPLHADQKLVAGDLVLTGSSGRVEWSLNPGSSLQVGHFSQVRIYETSLDGMHFDIERGEVFAIVKSLDNHAALVLDTPPALLIVSKGGRYRVRVAADDATEASVRDGELRFVNGEGKVIKIKTRRRVRFNAGMRRRTWDTAMTTARH